MKLYLTMVRFVPLKKAQGLLPVIFSSSTLCGRVIDNVEPLEIVLLAAVVVDYIDLGVVHNLSCSIFSDLITFQVLGIDKENKCMYDLTMASFLPLQTAAM